MQAVKIREISVDRLKAAAAADEPLAITNANLVCAVFVPMSEGWVHEWATRNSARIATSERLLHAETAAKEPFFSLEQLADDPPLPPRRPAMQMVPIRRLTGKAIAEIGKTFVLTQGIRPLGLVVPVPPGWVDGLILQNLTELVNRAYFGDDKLAALHYARQALGPRLNPRTYEEWAEGERAADRPRPTVKDLVAHYGSFKAALAATSPEALQDDLAQRLRSAAAASN